MNTEVMPQSLDLFSKEPTLLSIEKQVFYSFYFNS